MGMSIALATLGACLGSAPPTALATSKAHISGLAATPSIVPSAGTTTITASVSGAQTCTLESKAPVPGLPMTFSCEGGSVHQAVQMPASNKPTLTKYKLVLVATGDARPAKAKVDVNVSPEHYSLTPTEVQGLTDAAQITAGLDDACATLASGHIDCWGWDKFGQLGNGAEGGEQDAPVEVLNVENATGVAASASFTCASLVGGKADCWGANSFGQLGDG